MAGRWILVQFVAGSGVVHLLPTLPRAWTVWAMLTVLAAVVVWSAAPGMAGAPFGAARRKLCPSPGRPGWRARMGPWLVPLLAVVAGMAQTTLRAEWRLGDALAVENVNQVSRVVVRIVQLPSRNATGYQFDADVLESVPAGVPARIRVNWPEPGWRGPYARRSAGPADVPELVPGQIWRMALVLRRPHGASNPGGFDYEGHAFANGIRATGTVRGSPVLLADQPWAGVGVVAQRVRHRVRTAMGPYLDGLRYGGVLLALSVGDQASVAGTDWDVFRRTGLTHLMAISGTHITLVAGLAGWLVMRLWSRLRWRGRRLAERVPAQTAAAVAALVTALGYSMLAGWGVPARRSFFMLATIALMLILRISLSRSIVLALAAAVVVVLDPWATLSAGFWLSFFAVGVLLAIAGHAGHAPSGRRGVWRHWLAAFGNATRVQWLISVALLPILALLFNEVPLVSPVSNAYAIPLVSLLITPLALLGAMLACLPFASALTGPVVNVAHHLVAIMMGPTQWLADMPGASMTLPDVPLALTALAFAGLVLGLLPRGLPGTRLGWLLILPALLWQPKRPPQGAWDAHALDVGQAGAIVVRTARHTLLFDAGIRHHAESDSGQRVIVPFLASQGIRRLDGLMVSHADIDHVGGLRSVLESVPVRQSFASFSLDAWLQREAGMLVPFAFAPPLPLAMAACQYGQHWTLDGVSFQVLWPLRGTVSGLGAGSRERNDNSCVLRVRGQHHSLLLTGDINAAQERDLVARGLGAHDVVLAAHHGSKGSSSAEFVRALRARHVIIQSGAHSRYGHPHAQTLQRWGAAEARLWQTAGQGAIHVKSRADGLNVTGHRTLRRRYWHGH